MILQDALDQIENLSDAQVIFARKPWTFDAEAEIGELDENFCVPAEIKVRGLDYFLEAHVAREVLESPFGRDAKSPERRCELLLYYAENDAYPDWP